MKLVGNFVTGNKMALQVQALHDLETIKKFLELNIFDITNLYFFGILLDCKDSSVVVFSY